VKLGSLVVPALLALPAPTVAADAFDPWRDSARYALEYRADLGAVAAGSGAPTRIWLPMPHDTPHQAVFSTRVSAPCPHRETRDPEGNRILYLECPGGAPASGEVVAEFVVDRWPSRGRRGASGRSDGIGDRTRYLGPARRIPLDGPIREIAIRESEGLRTEPEKIRAFYDYVVRTMRYGKEGVGWGNGDAIWACTSKYGNCTDFHSLFIGLARSQGIPARFVIGFPIPADADQGTVPGYHCWAEAYERSRGWMPLDASEAKKSGRVDDYFGAIPSDRVEFTIGRDLRLEPAQAGEPVNYFIHPYAEVNGKASELRATVQFRRLSVTRAPASASPEEAR
jgi:transglutaminase-like putative cysteine protease